MSALLLLTHTLTHNRKAAGGRSGLFSKSNRHFPSHAVPIGLEITPFFLQGDFGTKGPCVALRHRSASHQSLRPVKEPGNRVFMRFPGVSVCREFSAVPAADNRQHSERNGPAVGFARRYDILVLYLLLFSVRPENLHRFRRQQYLPVDIVRLGGLSLV